VNFHAWCVRQLTTYNVGKPPKDTNLDAYFEACVEKVIRSVDQKLIPSAQYDAVLVDEGHDFKPEWFKLVVQMIHPDTNSLLVLYDDAQSIYNGPKKLRFSFSSVGVQAKGRTTILKLNYRNTAEILSVARAFADDLLSPQDTEEDQAPTVQPMSTGRRGSKPVLVKLPSIKDEVDYIVNRLAEANRTGMPWKDMGILYRRYTYGQQLADAFTRKCIPFQWQQDKKSFYSPLHDSVKLITMHSSKGLEFPFVCIPAIGAPSKEEDVLQDEARLLYVAMTRATQELVMTHCESTLLASKLQKAMGILETL
jgi:superfamily I DNA/RNA helicase